MEMVGTSRVMARAGDTGEVVAGFSHSNWVKFIALCLAFFVVVSGIWGRGVGRLWSVGTTPLDNGPIGVRIVFLPEKKTGQC